jgi:hypothetical protein
MEGIAKIDHRNRRKREKKTERPPKCRKNSQIPVAK